MAAVAGVSYKMTILPLRRQWQRRLSQQSPDTGHATQAPKVPCKGHRPGWGKRKQGGERREEAAGAALQGARCRRVCARVPREELAACGLPLVKGVQGGSCRVVCHTEWPVGDPFGIVRQKPERLPMRYPMCVW